MSDAEQIQEAEVVQEPEPAREGETNTDMSMALQIYKNVAMVPFKDEVQSVLRRFTTATPENKMEEMYDILPTGELYLSHLHYRRILNEAFGHGGWSMVPMYPEPRVHAGERTSQLVQLWALIAHGQYVSESMGGAEYDPKNARQLWSDAYETVKSNAIMRLCKDLGLAGDCWDRRYIQAWKKKHAIAVWVGKSRKNNQGVWTPEGDLQWRRVDADPLRGEIRPVREGETKIQVYCPSFQVYAEVGADKKPPTTTKAEPKSSTKQATKPPESPAEPQSPPAAASAPPDPEQTPLLAKAHEAGHGNYFVAKNVLIVGVQKEPWLVAGKQKTDGSGKPVYNYTAKTDNEEELKLFSKTDANTLHHLVVANEKRSEDAKETVDLQCKVRVKEYNGVDHWFINLEEILAKGA